MTTVETGLASSPHAAKQPKPAMMTVSRLRRGKPLLYPELLACPVTAVLSHKFPK